MVAIEGDEQREDAAVLKALMGGSIGEVVVPRTRRVRKLQYFKRCERPGCIVHRTMRGWVVVGPTRESNMYEHQEYIENKHMTPLPEEFGVEVYGQEKGYMTGKSDGSRPTRYARILMHPQGMAQFPVDQIIAFGWHRHPELRQLMTPEQREAAEAVLASETSCPFGCNDPVRSGEPLRFHNDELRNAHLYAFHRGADMARMTASAIGEELRKASIGGSTEVVGAVVAAVLQAMQSAQAPKQQPVAYAELDEEQKRLVASLAKREASRKE